ncbi:MULTISPECIES: bifunctional phosphoribosyl-AMP cyclohydrolase/phosphoribosyl-ATP diphosphatase HisIE [unclassified Staphylococcus]|uniref:bifunctional phosphoribosyl-AMP cyclohydrolase/phosphoribosyl-ATP diphosphatase HisIE n=1 Tax=unclassified Staphylococcus TaxID=91994 RepID=UPI0021D2DB79|nr:MULTISPECIES: bifunctional phosphoribosyl-AMP cyclohydrolase/phosphoribosyl-ATP diphosphatase HisIE [unclassified Staphylococcus]UXR69495.1 bifunctional phosphoribosyl-AMP cyclohydrolase/phosphoribosyl-ATP diphosphatase HisIE [Staphylococcus sp. IVB6246]UXR71552.1 bifunctional phosphoribosyl-AMP cyclohydrolase/phosphoribosyl-ATP diphosphatase HisIE [Staphylococcus sp. IVB6240]UXR73830.1 bifunctional phosphoribosyl-AMP cyclohydrolase/phosphoribosyl-ATP diphosphatase HisIE [Staphylococcus sp. I
MALKPDFSKGLLPAILQDATTQQVLMLGYMNEEAFERTVNDGVAWFYSRSKQRLWKKGETSEHTQQVVDIRLDCDDDTILLFVNPQGPTCHTGSQSCFNTPVPYQLQQLETTIQQRASEQSDKSYTQYLLTEGKEKITKKFGEEAFEVVIAAMKNDRSELIAESADLLYHLFVLLHEQGVTINEVESLLSERHNTQNNFKGERQDIENW